MFPQNPDPNIEPFFKCAYNGVVTMFTGSLRSRYEIMKDANANDALQREMNRLTTLLFLNGVVCGVAIASAVAVAVFVLYKEGLIAL